MDKLYILDASGYLYRSYFAIRQMTNAKGESTNALFGFIRSVLKLMKDFQPTHMVAVFDGPANALARTTMYADYKAHRKGMPKDLLYQISWAQQFCQLIGIPELMIPEVEADDTMGSVAQWAAQKGALTYLCTSDKDMCQMVTERIFILNSFKDNQILGPEEVSQQFGVSPSQMIDFLAITGDTSDNIPGLSGFGPKTAADLLRQFGSLDYLLEHPTEVSGRKKQETLVQEKEKVLLSRRLVTINTSVPFTQDEAFFKLGQSNISGLREFYAYMNFSSLLRELEIQAGSSSQRSIESGNDVSYQLIDDLQSLQELVRLLAQQTSICVDTETTSIHPMRAELVGIGVGFEPCKAWYIPVNGQLGLKPVIKELKPLFENPKIGFYGHNLKYDYHILLNYGITIANIGFDTILASYLLNSHSRQHSLDHLSLELFGKVKISIQELIGKGKHQISMQDVPLDKICIYCCEDVDYTMRLKEVLAPQLEERGLISLFYELELPLLSVLVNMERHGIFVDTHYLQHLSTELGKEIADIAEEIYAMAGEIFNLNSPKQLSQILFEKLRIRPPKKTATGYSTNAEVLESLKGEYPIAAKLLEYRSLEKLRSTYVDSLPQEVNLFTHRIHCTFNQSMAATGRLTCQDPNLQNIPVRTEVGRKIREAFRPQLAGWSYLAADYSQIELRLLAHLSEDPILMSAFQANEDIHTFTASQIFNVPIEEVTREQRNQAKTVNFGIMYGQQAFGLSQELGIDPKMAAVFIQMYFQRYHKVKEFLDQSKLQARKTGRAVTLLGRERLIPEITSPNMNIRTMAERLAINTPIQGTQADLIKMAMLEIERKLAERRLKAYMILQIHDELIFEVPDQELEEVKQLVHDSMVGIMPLKIPLVVDIHIGKNWKEC
jgi:DNA polymerase-1